MRLAVKAIETVYNGYRFRSRLEARWAVFFDALGLTYEYEKEGYDLGTAGWYLPDFWLPQFPAFVEIKGQQPTQDERAKAIALALMCKVHVFICVGDNFPLASENIFFYMSWNQHFRAIKTTPEGLEDLGTARQQHDARMSDMIAFDRLGYVYTFTPTEPFRFGFGMYEGKLSILSIYPTQSHDKIITDAATRARQSRFEHGERGGLPSCIECGLPTIQQPGIQCPHCGKLQVKTSAR